jgi:hypothetical protein
MIWVPFTLMLDTDVLLPLPLTVMVAVEVAESMSTTGWKPEAEVGPVIVTVLLDEVAL